MLRFRPSGLPCQGGPEQPPAGSITTDSFPNFRAATLAARQVVPSGPLLHSGLPSTSPRCLIQLFKFQLFSSGVGQLLTCLPVYFVPLKDEFLSNAFWNKDAKTDDEEPRAES
jgi:hypothetical protein